MTHSNGLCCFSHSGYTIVERLSFRVSVWLSGRLCHVQMICDKDMLDAGTYSGLKLIRSRSCEKVIRILSLPDAIPNAADGDHAEQPARWTAACACLSQ